MEWHQGNRQQKASYYIKGGLSLSFSIFLGLSFFSYSPTDPSLNSFGISLKVSNYCGYAGAFLADLFFQSFGLVSWLFIPLGFYLAWKFFRTATKNLLSQSLFLFLLFFISITCLLNLYFPKTLFYKDSISLGGAFASLILKALTPFFHVIGTGLILWSILIVSFLIYGQRFLFHFFIFVLAAVMQSWVALTMVFDFSFSFLSKKTSQIIQKDWAFLFQKMEMFFKKQKVAVPDQNIFTENPTHDQEPNLITEPVFKYEEKSVLGEESIPKQNEVFLEEETEQKNKKTKKQKIFNKQDRPSFDLLSPSPRKDEKINKTEVELLAKKLTDKLSQFSIGGQITAIKTGPAVIMFEFKPDKNVKVSRIKEMADDIRLAIASESVRIIAPIPGRDVVGIEASRPSREMVYLKDILEKGDFSKAKLPLILGVRSDNIVTVKDLAKIPHLLIAGTTGSGKSVFVISFIMGLLFRHTPQTLRLILVDPKRVDLSFFEGIPHLLAPIMSSCPEALAGLKWAIVEMEKRYRSLAHFGVRDISSFNNLIQKMTDKEKKSYEIQNEKLAQEEKYYFNNLPSICIIVEEFGDLMAEVQFKREIETSVTRLAQKARASGIHLVLAMQSPRKDVVTGVIKTNIPGRISFKVASGTDSRIILDEIGAERLLSQGDLLFLEPGTAKPLRYHSPFVSEKEVKVVVNHWKEQAEVCYEQDLVNKSKASGSESSVGVSGAEDPMYEKILNFVQDCDAVSASLLQRKFRIGYPRAARLVEVLHEQGIIGPPHGSKPREVLK